MVNTDNPNLILIIDDNPVSLRGMAQELKACGYHVSMARSGVDGLEMAHNLHPDLILLDVSMPRTPDTPPGTPTWDGFEVCRRLKAEPDLEDIPVIFLTAHDEEADRLTGFMVGGVDYLGKSFADGPETLARIRVHAGRGRAMRELRSQVNWLTDELNAYHTWKAQILELIQGGPMASVRGLVQFGRIEMDPVRWRVWIDQNEISLPKSEFQILLRLVQAKGGVVSYGELQQAIGAPSQNAAGYVVRRLRRRLPEGMIENRIKVGYRLL